MVASILYLLHSIMNAKETYGLPVDSNSARSSCEADVI